MEKEFNIQAFAEVIKKDFDELAIVKKENEQAGASLKEALKAVQGQEALKAVADSIEENLAKVDSQVSAITKADDAKATFVKTIREGYALFLESKKALASKKTVGTELADEPSLVESSVQASSNAEPKAPELTDASKTEKPAEASDPLSAFK